MTTARDQHTPRFALIRAKQEGREVLIVVDMALDADRLMARYPWLVSISLPMRRPDAKGLCDDTESERLADLEDALLDPLAAFDHRYAGRVTGHGVRVVHLYAPASEDFIDALRARAAVLGSGAEAIEVEDLADPDWDAYRAMSGGAGHSAPR